jgi:hypothetical protein
LGDSLAKLSSVAEPFNKIASAVLSTSAVMSSFVTSQTNGEKNWFLYRFLDETLKCSAVEWNISSKVLQQYGSALRGSILLAFHGSPKPETPLTLMLRPRLHFGDEALQYTPPSEDLESTDPVKLLIKPTAVQ